MVGVMKRITPNPILAEVEAFVERTGISRRRVGMEALSNGDLFARLRRGGRLWPENEQRLRDYMRANEHVRKNS